MNHLLRQLAPISDAGWELLDDEARERLRPSLAARRLVDFSGPHGWEHSATNLGRIEAVDVARRPMASAPLQRRVLPLVELRAEFSVSRAELRDNDRGAVDADLEPLDEAAQRIAIAENVAVFHGWAKAGIAGIAEASPVEAAAARRQRRGLPALGRPRGRGAARGRGRRALRPRPRPRRVHAGDRDRRARRLPAVRPPGEDPRAARSSGRPGSKGAVVLSLRGGDFLFESGQDLAIGYSHHDADAVHLYLEESFSFVVATPEAAAPLSS